MSNHSKNILIVEDEEIIRSSLRKLLERHNYLISEAVSVKAARKSFNLNNFDLIISDLRLPGGPGTDLINPASCVPVLVMTSYASLRSAVETMRQGAADYISKPFDHDEMLAAIKRIVNESKQDIDLAIAENKLLMGSSPEILRILRTIDKAAPTSAPVIIQGESGTGKRIVAEVIHRASAFAERAFVAINCASISAVQFSQQLEQLTEKATGTLFLANICELPTAQQSQAIEAIQQHNDIRCIASTAEDLQALSQSGKFRKDLFYSLNVVSIQVPALRRRTTDIPALAEYFLDQYSAELGTTLKLSADAHPALAEYNWPGNVRELQNMLYQGAILSEPGQAITPRILGMGYIEDQREEKADSVPIQSATNSDGPTGLSLEDYFTSFVLENQENMSETALAQKLGISRKSLWERRNKLGISRKKSDSA
ncbi:MAG: sigma-54 dependent transcriptional regulator [Porticoccaceae bacterium]|nr:sigma-54 dependent transcriptional regulator [Porticoccaceae bacterium]